MGHIPWGLWQDGPSSQLQPQSALHPLANVGERGWAPLKERTDRGSGHWIWVPQSELRPQRGDRSLERMCLLREKHGLAGDRG